MSAFKAYDIRGVWGEDIDEELCFKAGYFLPSLLNADHVIVGRDMRLSSAAAHEALLDGITSSGADVWDLGLSTTPLVYFATGKLDADCSVQITASHNPAEYNGLKISKTGVASVGGGNGLKELEALVNNGKVVPSAVKGKVLDYSFMREQYLDYLLPYAKGLEGLDISIDCSSGMAGILIKDLLGDKPHYINDTLDGSFPAHEPNPLDRKNVRMLEEEVGRNGSDCGLMYDGDADRVVFVDETGSFIQPDYAIAVLGLYYKKLGRLGIALQDIRTSRSTTEYLENLGFSVATWKVGHAFAIAKLRELGGVFGGELAGHYYMKDFYWCDSGLLASLLFLSVVSGLKKEGRTISSLVSEIVRYENSGEINFKLEKKDDAIKELCSLFIDNGNPIRVLDFDGYRIEFDDWWFNVRKSNTEPYLRIVAEAKTKELLYDKLEIIKAVIGKYS